MNVTDCRPAVIIGNTERVLATHWYIGPLDRMGITCVRPACANPRSGLNVTERPEDVTCLRCRDTQRWKKAMASPSTSIGSPRPIETPSPVVTPRPVLTPRPLCHRGRGAVALKGAHQ